MQPLEGSTRAYYLTLFFAVPSMEMYRQQARHMEIN
jgi:hypothetical protein